MNSQKITNLFMVYSPLHCLCAELIARQFEADAHNVVFYIRRSLESSLDKEIWADVVYHPWPRFEPEPGIMGRIHRTRHNLQLVAKYCQGSDQIRLHATVIDTESINYHINYLRKCFPSADFRVRLIPDGTMNLKRHPQGLLREFLKYFRLFRRIVSPDLHYYTFKGDRTGSDDDIVEKIYTLHGFPHEYDPRKVIELPPFMQGYDDYNRDQVSKRALVIGQPLIVYKATTQKETDKITQAIYDFLRSNNIEQVYYKSHPRDKTRECALAEYSELIINESLEQHLAHHPYGIVIGVCSTALLTGRMVLPAWCRVVSIGMNLLLFKKESERAKLSNTFNSLGVETIDA